MKKEELIKRIDQLENLIDSCVGADNNRFKAIEERIDKLLEQTVIEQPQERKLIMSVDELNNDEIAIKHYTWAKNKLQIFHTFMSLKFIESQWNEGKEFDWHKDNNTYILEVYQNKWISNYCINTLGIFNFHTKHHTELFLTTFAKELEIIKPLFS